MPPRSSEPYSDRSLRGGLHWLRHPKVCCFALVDRLFKPNNRLPFLEDGDNSMTMHPCSTRRLRPRVWLYVLAAALVLLPTLHVHAQDDRGTLMVTVLDQSGGVVPGATVTLSGGAQATSTSAVADQDGRARLRDVPAGTFVISAESGGLLAGRQADVVVRPGEETAVTVRVDVLGVREQVDVGAAAARPYAPPAAVSSNKVDVPLRELPMAVQVIPQRVFRDRAAFTIKDAVQNVSGVVSASYSYYDNLQVRGFITQAQNFRDGLQVRYVTGSDTALLERVEVVKGPASMLYGRVEPGGLVNMVTKRPQATRGFSVQQQAGNFGVWRTTVDATGPLNQNGSLSYRAIGAFNPSSSFMDGVKGRNQVGALYLAWRPTERFELNTGLELQQNRFVDTEDIGIPIDGTRPLDVSRNAFYGDPIEGGTPNRHNRGLLSASWTYRFNRAWALTNRIHWQKLDQRQLTIWFAGFDGVSTLDRGLWYVNNDRRTTATNLDLTGDVRIGGTRHRVLAGMDYFRYGTDWNGFSSTTDLIPSIDVYQPRYGVNAAALDTLDDNFFYIDKDRWAGVYVQDHITVQDRWHLLVGGRFDKATVTNGYAETSIGDARAAEADESNSSFSPRVGLLRQLDAATSVYGSFSRSFGANNGRSADGVPFEPEVGRQFEFGVKRESAGGALTASAAVFRLAKTNVLTPDLSTLDPTDQIAIGEVRSQGLEVDLLGQVTDNLSVIGGYSFTQAEITVDANGNEGKSMPNVPRHTLNAWVRFDANPGSRRGWEVGGGIAGRSLRQGDNTNAWQLPGYSSVDMMFRYRVPAGHSLLSLQVNVQNLFDTTYFDRGGFSAAKYGSPRAFIASVGVGR